MMIALRGCNTYNLDIIFSFLKQKQEHFFENFLFSFVKIRIFEYIKLNQSTEVNNAQIRRFIPRTI